MTGPTRVRHRFIAVSMAMAFILYLDRVCLAQIVASNSFDREVHLTPDQIGRILSVFFTVYAICQVPAGWISDRLGGRKALTAYIVLWSLATAGTGLFSAFPALYLMRSLCGAAEAGAYPTAGALVRRWVPLRSRAWASSLISLGGRAGGTLAPFVTAWMVVSLGHWRPVLWIDGSVGLAIAALYWVVARDRPSEHPHCNAAEQALIASDSAPLARRSEAETAHGADYLRTGMDAPRPSPRELARMLWSFCQSGTLWACAGVAFLTNFGWGYLITWLPTYLKTQQHVSDLASGHMVTLVLACGIVGQLAGGWLSDRAAEKLGLRWGRVSTMFVSGILSGLGYIACLHLHSAWAIVACCGMASFGVDLGSPAIWAYMQDVGGRVTATAFGWMNMWGNLGNAFVARVTPMVLASAVTEEAGQRRVFLVCALALFLSSLAALGMDASKPLKAGAT